MAISVQTEEKQKSIQSILEEVLVVNGKIHRDAVDAGIMFMDIYSRWMYIADFLGKEKGSLFGIIVHGVLTGTAKTDPEFIATLSNFNADIIKQLEGKELRVFSEFMVDISMGIIFTNPFIIQNNKFLGCAVMLDGLSMLKDWKTYHVISAIGHLVGGTNTAMKLNLRKFI